MSSGDVQQRLGDRLRVYRLQRLSYHYKARPRFNPTAKRLSIIYELNRKHYVGGYRLTVSNCAIKSILFSSFNGCRVEQLAG